MAGYNITIDNSAEHIELLRQFWTENNPNWPTEKLRWFYEQNPCGPAWCALARKADDPQVIGVLAVFPRRVMVGKRKLMAGITGDFAVHKNHRVLGPALMLQKAAVALCVQGRLDFLYGYPNRNSHPVQKRVGFQILGESLRLVRVLRSGEYVARRVKPRALANLVTGPIDLAMKLSARETTQRHSGKYDFEVLSEPDSRFDQLWSDTMAWRKLLVIGERSAEFLKWRFTDCPNRDYRFFAVESNQSGRLIGYIVYIVEDGEATIVDLLAASDGSELDGLLSTFLRYQWRKKVKSIAVTYFGHNSLVEKLMQYRFSVRNPGDSHLTHVGSQLSDLPELLDAKQGYFLPADNDI